MATNKRSHYIAFGSGNDEIASAFIQTHTNKKKDNTNVDEYTILVVQNKDGCNIVSEIKMHWKDFKPEYPSDSDDYDAEDYDPYDVPNINEKRLKALFPQLVTYHVSISNSLQSIEHYAFRNCTSLSSITFPKSLQSIGDCAFRNCTSLSSITLPNSIQSIGNCAFSKCTSLSSITFPNSLQSIGSWAFRNCTSLQKLTVSKSTLQKNSQWFRHITQHNRNVVLNISDQETRTCIICNDDTTVNVVFTKCLHVSVCVTCCVRGKYLFHGDALVSCPICRTKQKSSEVKLVTHTT